MLWYGSVESIPSGWTLCDGTMGTPDLRDKFVIGAGSTYNPGDGGGSTGHNHTFLGDGHAHDLGPGNDVISDAPNGNRYHGTSSSPASGTTYGSVHLPPYHALCYIMKLPMP